MFDEHLTMTDHVNSIVRRASFGLRKIGRIRKMLDRNATEKLVHAFVSSHLDSCNSLLLGLPSSSLIKLQRVQNSAARLVSRSPFREHITPVLQALHWLPMEARVEYKTLLLVHTCLYQKAPEYISGLVCLHESTRKLRSSNTGLLKEPTCKTVSYGMHSFQIQAPKLWNKLPIEMRNETKLVTFKSKLKTILFKRSYGVI